MRVLLSEDRPASRLTADFPVKRRAQRRRELIRVERKGSGVAVAGPGDVEFPELFDLVGVMAGALDGALFYATRGRVTLAGVAVFGFVTTFGGAVVRDMLLGQGPASVLSDPLLMAWLVAIVLAGAVVRLRLRLTGLLEVVDSIYLPVWVVLGTDKAIHAGLDVLSTLLLGVITGVGGGLLRDLLAGEVPNLVRRDSAYALTALAAAVLFLLMHLHQASPREVDGLVTVSAVLLGRMVWLRTRGRRSGEQGTRAVLDPAM